MQIAILLYDKFTALDAIGPYEILSRLPNTTFHFIAEQAGPVTSDTGALTIIASAFQDFPHPDIFVVPGGNEGTMAATENEAVLAWVRQAHESSRYSVSVCTGSWILGAAGLLQGLQATTHWAGVALLESYGATYVAERYVQQGKIITAAGVSAGIDMALFLASELEDELTAKALQLLVEYDPHPPFNAGNAQHIDPEVLERLGKLSQHE